MTPELDSTIRALECDQRVLTAGRLRELVEQAISAAADAARDEALALHSLCNPNYCETCHGEWLHPEQDESPCPFCAITAAVEAEREACAETARDHDCKESWGMCDCRGEIAREIRSRATGEGDA